MLRYNFRPSLVDHSQILILVRPFYTTSDEDYSFVLDKLSPLSYAEIKGFDRNILLKFTKGHSRDTLEWGRLQIHRRPLGFVGVAKLSSDPVQQPKDYEKIERRFDNLISQYENFLYDSRCIIVGPENPNFKSNRKDIFYLPDTDAELSTDFVDYITDFVTSIFVILESKRADKISENFERMVLPTAPKEQELTVTESDTRFLKRKCLGRNKKILGDFCLLAGLPQEALMHYTNSSEHLRGVNDYLWMGSALEGICAASNYMMLGETVIKPDAKGLTIDKSNININIAIDNNEQEKIQSYLANSIDDLFSKYSECLTCYKKFDTGPVELEAHFKFIRLLLKYQKKIEISQIIQSLLVLPFNFNDIEKIDFTTMLASIYDQICLKRKAAFFRRRTALYYIHNTSSKQALSKAMSLLQNVAPAYQLGMDSNTSSSDGWSSVQLKVLLDMLHICRRLGNELDSVRLLCFILEKYPKQLSAADHTDLVDLLEEFSDNPEPLRNEESNDNDVELINPLPIIRDFLPKRLSHHLQPLKNKSVDKNGPFIFSSLSSKTKKEEEDIIWVCGDVTEVAMVVDNPLPAEIKVTNMTLITEGISFEAYPATLALPAQSGSFPFMLLGQPSQPGNLIIKGYKVEVLGICNTVFLPTPITVEVTPVLPILKLSSTLPRAPNASSLDPEDQHYQTLFTQANLYRGHSCTGKVTLENAGKVPVTTLKIKLKKPREGNVIFDESYVQQQLPIAPGESLHLDVTIMPEQSWKLFNNQDKIEATLIMTYSCEEGEANGYMREIQWITYVKVMPSIEFSNFQVLEIERHPTCCMICFDAMNMTSVSMNVTTQVKIDKEKLGAISQKDSCLQDRHIELLSKTKTSCEIHLPRVSQPPPENRRQTMEDVYQKFVNEAIQLNWRLSDTNYSGIASLHNLKVTPEMVETFKPKHLNISIRVNELSVNEGELINTDECKLVEISVVLTNAHDMNLEDMALHVNPYQQCYRSANEIKQLYLPSGILNKGIKKLCPGESYEHNCGLLFLYHGDYMVDVSCSLNRFFNAPVPNRSRAFAITSEDTSLSEDNASLPVPLSPRTVTKKLKSNENDFWAQSFGVCVK